MEKLVFSVLQFALMAVAVQGGREVVCEASVAYQWGYFEGEMPTCLFNETTIIDSNDVVIKSDYEANGLYFQNNKNIAHLPIGISKTFPNIWILDATYCMIKRLRPENFEGLSQLSTIWLGGNLIDEIPRDTFKDLEALSDIDLRDNYITIMSPEAFSNSSLNIVSLMFMGNICIDRDYTVLVRAVKEITTYCIRTPKKMNNFDLLKTSTTTKADIGIPKVGCRRTRRCFWGYVSGRLDTCLLNRSITIDANNTRLDTDYNARGFYMQDNKKIFYLPVDIYKQFPALIILDATYCSVRTVGPENIRNLKNLEYLWLRENNLQFIPKGTMKGLVSLVQVDLRYNRIKSMPADVFVGLKDLNEIFTSGNPCIDEDFVNITDAMRVISKTCKPGGNKI